MPKIHLNRIQFRVARALAAEYQHPWAVACEPPPPPEHPSPRQISAIAALAAGIEADCVELDVIREAANALVLGDAGPRVPALDADGAVCCVHARGEWSIEWVVARDGAVTVAVTREPGAIVVEAQFAPVDGEARIRVDRERALSLHVAALEHMADTLGMAGAVPVELYEALPDGQQFLASRAKRFFVRIAEMRCAEGPTGPLN